MIADLFIRLIDPMRVAGYRLGAVIDIDANVDQAGNGFGNLGRQVANRSPGRPRNRVDDRVGRESTVDPPLRHLNLSDRRLNEQSFSQRFTHSPPYFAVTMVTWVKKFRVRRQGALAIAAQTTQQSIAERDIWKLV